MRRVAVLVILANVLAFVWWRGGFDGWLDTGREPQRVARQLAADRVRVVPTEQFDASRSTAR